MIVLAIDPGPEQSGWARLMADSPNSDRLLGCGVAPNADVLDLVRRDDSNVCAIEMIASYGMAVGREVFETCVWIGRLQQSWRRPADVRLVYRKTVKLHLCGSPKAKDANIRQALLDRWPRSGGGATPQVGTKASPGPLYGISSHAWPALAVAVTVRDCSA